MRTFFLQTTVVILAINVVSFFYLPEVLWSMVIFGPLILLGLHDITQKSHSILEIFLCWDTCVFYWKRFVPKYISILWNPIQADVLLVENSEASFTHEQKTRAIQFLLVQSKMFMKPATNGSTTHSVQKKWSMRTCES